MADYVVRFTGQDNLSGTLKNIKNELTATGGSATKLEQIQQKLDRITHSSAPLKTQLRSIQALMAEMNFNGLSNTEVFTQAAQKAGQLKDAITDASTATRLLSSDTANLDAFMKGMQGIAAAGTIATGAMGLFDEKNEEVSKAILKVQSAMAILNGVQQLSNVFNKDSILMLKIKQLTTTSNTSAEIQDTIAVNANTVAVGNNTKAKALNATATKTETTAITGASVATKGLETVTNGASKAVSGLSKAMKVAGWVGVALMVYELCDSLGLFSSKADEAEQEVEQLKNASEEIQKAWDSEAQKLATNITKFRELQSTWNSLTNDLNGQKKFIVENKNELHNLGLAVATVDDCNRVFTKNAEIVIKAFEAQANMAAVQAAAIQDLTNVYIELGKIQDKIRKNESFSGEELRNYGFNYYKNSAHFSPTTWTALGFGDSYYVRDQQTVKSLLVGAESHFKKEHEGTQKMFADLQKRYSDELKQYKFEEPTIQFNKSREINSNSSSSSSSRHNRNRNHTTTTTPKKTEEVLKYNSDAQTVKEINDNIKYLDKERESLKLNSGAYNTNIELRDMWHDKLKRAEKYAQSLAELKKNPLKPRDLKDLIQLPKLETPSLTESMKQSQRDRVKRIQEAIQQTVEDYDFGIIGYDKAKDYIEGFNKYLESIGATPIEVEIKTKGQKEAETSANNLMKNTEGIRLAATAAGSAFSAMGDAIGGIAGNAVNVAGLMAQAIATMIEGYATATAQAASLGPWAWVAFGLTGLAQLSAMVSQVKSIGAFADGGVVMGNSFHGDKILANLNAGEMVLNKSQQANLFRMLDNNNGSTGGKVEFVIKGSTLQGVLKNYNNKIEKVR